MFRAGNFIFLRATDEAGAHYVVVLAVEGRPFWAVFVESASAKNLVQLAIDRALGLEGEDRTLLWDLMTSAKDGTWEYIERLRTPLLQADQLWDRVLGDVVANAKEVYTTLSLLDSEGLSKVYTVENLNSFISEIASKNATQLDKVVEDLRSAGKPFDPEMVDIWFGEPGRLDRKNMEKVMQPLATILEKLAGGPLPF